MSDQDASRKYLTVSKKNLLSRWLVNPTVSLSRNDAIVDRKFEIDDETSTLEKIGRFRTTLHGDLEQIISKCVRDRGRVLYKVKWTDGTCTEEDARVLRKIDETKVLAFETHDMEIDEKTEGDLSVDLFPAIRSKRIRRQKKQRHQQEEEKQQEQNTQTVSRTPPPKKSGPFQDIPYYQDNDFVDMHWKHCSKCQSSGYPNGAPIHGRRRQKTIRSRSGDDDDDDLLLSSEEECEIQGRLLLCITCSAATHEGCLSDRSYRCLRKCVKDGQTIAEYQCASCLRVGDHTKKLIPPCERCHQVHSITNLVLLPYKKISSATLEVSDQITGTGVDRIDVDDVRADELGTVDPVGLFRCSACTRAFHYNCLPQFPDEHGAKSSQEELEATCRKNWKCAECISFTKKPEQIITWRIVGDPGDKKLNMTLAEASSQPKELLIRWQDTSYRHLSWVSENWAMYAARNLYTRYVKRVGDLPHVSENELVPKTWKTIERVLIAHDKYGRVIEQGPEDRISRVLVKFFDLKYDEACWDDPPSRDNEPELYSSYIVALQQYQRACRVRVPEQMKERVDDVRLAASRENYGKHEIKKQPDFIKGGTLMPHQLDGLNWLTYQWEKNLPCILADDMGLGKTIQIVSFLNYLLRKFAIYPFLIVVPNSTASNWLREFAKWAPNMVVVPYYGSSKSRRLSREYELLRGGGSQGKFRCHAVVLTYESANADISFLSKVRFWPALIVDEAQRLKNDSTQLFQKLKTLKWDHTVLMTGTPLQNNIRELINIMHFVDPKKFANLDELEEKYSELTKEVVQELHEQLKPYFLRRTKEMVLKTLPPKSEIIVPVTMTTLQKEVCRNIMTKNLISFAALSGEKTARKSKKGLANILMQLRKALNHPYLIPDIEVKQATPEATQRALVDASSKLRVLDQMLPKLFKNGHRVLIFSTLRLTLDVLEDYLIHEQIKYERLDGMTSNFDRVKSIDAFNATDSEVKVFLLTTKAGGVGINLATADTVIMWDFDFNPHSDMQAISRAYRIGQTKPVLVLKFMTRFSVEEKIAQKAKKKMVLDHLVVDKMDEDDLEEDDVESILKFGAQALFEDEEDKEITYDSSAIDRLLDRSKIVRVQDQNKQAMSDAEKPMSFSFAKVWSHNAGAPTEDLPEEESEAQEKAENDFWNKFLQQKRAELESAMSKTEELGRGARKRAIVRYFDSSDAKKESLAGNGEGQGKGKGKGKGKKEQERDTEVDDAYVDRPEPLSEDEIEGSKQINPPIDDTMTNVPPAQDQKLKGKRKKGKAAASTDSIESSDPPQPLKKRRRAPRKKKEQPLDHSLLNQQHTAAGFEGQYQLHQYAHQDKDHGTVYFTPANGGMTPERPHHGVGAADYWMSRPPYTSNHPYYLQQQRDPRSLSQQPGQAAYSPAQFPATARPPRPPIYHYTQSYPQPQAQPHWEHRHPHIHQQPCWFPTQPGAHQYPYPSNPARPLGPNPGNLTNTSQAGDRSIPTNIGTTTALNEARPTEELVNPLPQSQLPRAQVELLRNMLLAVRQGQQGSLGVHPFQSQQAVPVPNQYQHSLPSKSQTPVRVQFGHSTPIEQIRQDHLQDTSPMTSFAATQALMNPSPTSVRSSEGQAIEPEQIIHTTDVTMHNNNNGIPPINRLVPEKLVENTRELLSILDQNRGHLTKLPYMQTGQKAATTTSFGSQPTEATGPLTTPTETQPLDISENISQIHGLDSDPINEQPSAVQTQSAGENSTECVIPSKPAETTPEPSIPPNSERKTSGGQGKNWPIFNSSLPSIQMVQASSISGELDTARKEPSSVERTALRED